MFENSKFIFSARITKRLLVAVVMLSLVGCFDRESKEESKSPYPEAINYDIEIDKALIDLKPEQRLMLVFGANWCPTCRRVDASMKQPEIEKYLKEHFTVIKVNVGDFDKNLHVAKRFEHPIRQGIPSIIIINKDGSMSTSLRTMELSKLHKSGRKAFYKRLREI